LERWLLLSPRKELIMDIDPTRHLSVFSPEAFGNKRVDVIGCGATGSRITLSLVKLGIKNIHCWDFDKVEEHNIANQIYFNGAIGLPKVEALEIEADGITPHEEKVDGSQQLGEIVFLLTDTMSSRKEIWEGIKFQPNLRLLIETRMGADNGRIYTVNPKDMNHHKKWEDTLYSDEEAETSACGTSISVGPTAEIISGLAVWQLLRWFSIEQGKEDTLEHEIIFSLRPTVALCQNF